MDRLDGYLVFVVYLAALLALLWLSETGYRVYVLLARRQALRTPPAIQEGLRDIVREEGC